MPANHHRGNQIGTNSFHGDAFEFLRNGALNGSNWATHTNDGLKRNQFGGTVGGPVKKDKLFFFFGYQGTITRQTAFTNNFIPTQAMIAGISPACPLGISGLFASATGPVHEQQNESRRRMIQRP